MTVLNSSQSRHSPEHAARPPWPRTLDLRREANTTFVDSNEQLNMERRTFDRFGAG